MKNIAHSLHNQKTPPPFMEWLPKNSQIIRVLSSYRSLFVLLAGVSLVFSLAPYRLYYLAPFSLIVPVLCAQHKPQRAFLYGYLWGIAAYATCFSWIYYSLWVIAHLSWWITFCIMAMIMLYLACYPAIALWMTCRITKKPYWRWLITFPSMWTISEYLRGKIFTGFSWGEIGLTQIADSPLASLAPIFGIHGVTFALALIIGGYCLIFLSSSLKTIGWLTSGLFLLGLQMHSMKSWHWTTPVGKPVKIALAQGNIPQQLKWDPQIFYYTLNWYYQQISHTQADIMILPESVMPTVYENLPLGYLDNLKKIAQFRHMALALGILRNAKEGHSYLNTVMSLNDQHYYTKRHLVPFGEYNPLAITQSLYQSIKKTMAETIPGKSQQPPLTLAKQRIAFNICYEDSFGDELIGTASQATMLANVSNLAWFAPYSIALDQHLQLSQTRALENERPMLRATNTGKTAIIDPKGHITAIAPSDKPYVLIGMSQGYIGLTPYMRYGDLPILIICGLMLAITWFFSSQHCLKIRQCYNQLS